MKSPSLLAHSNPQAKQYSTFNCVVKNETISNIEALTDRCTPRAVPYIPAAANAELRCRFYVFYRRRASRTKDTLQTCVKPSPSFRNVEAEVRRRQLPSGNAAQLLLNQGRETHRHCKPPEIHHSPEMMSDLTHRHFFGASSQHTILTQANNCMNSRHIQQWTKAFKPAFLSLFQVHSHFDWAPIRRFMN